MKLIHQNSKGVAIATDDYEGPEAYIVVDSDFNLDRFSEYVVVEGVATLPVPDPREVAKESRTAAVEAIKVTTAAGNTFDGDEMSQGRMARAILGLSTGLALSVRWVLADNSVVQATAAELTEALALAGQAQADIWVL